MLSDETFDEAARTFKVFAKCYANAFRIDEAVINDIHPITKRFAHAGMIDETARQMMLGLKAYIWGGDLPELTVTAPDGPVERLRQRLRDRLPEWARRFVGRVRVTTHTFRLSTVYPELGKKIPLHVGNTYTLVAEGGDRTRHINYVRVGGHEAAMLRWEAFTQRGFTQEQWDWMMGHFSVPGEEA